MSETKSKAVDLAVTAIGMVSALGLDAPTSCAAARAGLSRAVPVADFKIYSKSAWAYVGVVGHTVRNYTDGFQGVGKLARLASGALADLRKSCSLEPGQWLQTPIVACLPSRFFQSALAKQLPPGRAAEIGLSGHSDAAMDSLIQRACRLIGLQAGRLDGAAQFDDQAGFASAMQKAAVLLDSGEFERCVVGGVDACTDAAYLAAAHHFHSVKAGDQAAGFQPGESAAFLLVEKPAVARARGARVHAHVAAASYGRDAVDRVCGKPALGVGLAQVAGDCLAAAGDKAGNVSWLIADLNGDAFRANDWGYALVRLMPDYPHIGSMPVSIPAESFGEIGAASGPVAVCMAARAFERGYAPSRGALVTLTSYSGSRGAFILTCD